MVLACFVLKWRGWSTVLGIWQNRVKLVFIPYLVINQKKRKSPANVRDIYSAYNHWRWLEICRRWHYCWRWAPRSSIKPAYFELFYLRSWMVVHFCFNFSLVSTLVMASIITMRIPLSALDSRPLNLLTCCLNSLLLVVSQIYVSR